MTYVLEVQRTRKNKKRIDLIKGLDKQIFKPDFPDDCKRYVFNFSSVNLDRTQLEVLSLGPKFCDNRRHVDHLKTDVQFENLFAQTQDLKPTTKVEHERFKTTLVDCCNQFKSNKHYTNSILTDKHREAIRKLKLNEHILITKPYKGSGTAILNKTDYIDKMNSLLSDQTKFQKLGSCKDLNEKTERQLTAALKFLNQHQHISEHTYNMLKPSGTHTPRLYGLPKIHKPDIPLRPILDMANSPYHSTAKWLVKLLDPLHQELAKHNIKEVFEFVDTIKNMNINGKTMLSLDITSLFTNIPLTETIDYICEQLIEKKIEIPIPINKMKGLLLKCTMNIYFKFNNEFFRQVDGVAMGSPLGPILANIFLTKLENVPLKDILNKLDYYCRYIDDTLIICDENIYKQEMLDAFNNVHPAIKLTSEEEKDNSITFLDVRLSRRIDGSIKRNMFRKCTWTGQYTHFQSFTPLQYKINLVKCLNHRIKLLCSEDSVEEEIVILKNTLRNNGYPDNFVKKYLVQSIKNRRHCDTVSKKTLYLKLDFKGDIAGDILTRRLKRSVERTFHAAKLHITFSTKPVLTQLIKDKLPKMGSSVCVYQFNYSCGASYIGRTQRALSLRVCEHVLAWLGKGVTKSINSTILSHLVDSEHHIKIEEAFSVLYQVPKYLPQGARLRLLYTAEAIWINSRRSNFCIRKKYIQPLCLPWPTTGSPNT
ncbi:unnamed protein product [Schistosoma haematobium]|nr:unnamed protein product [Schistosoma haematobium]